MTAAHREILLEEGVVLELVPTEAQAPARARVRLVAGEHCEGCPASGICRPDSDDRRVLDVVDPLGVTVGERVKVAVPGGAVLQASFLVYGLPLLLLVAGVVAGLSIWPAENPMRDLWSFLLGAGLAGLAVPVAARFARGGGAGGSLLEPRITEKVDEVVALGAES